jgi:hypothetical protein
MKKKLIYIIIVLIIIVGGFWLMNKYQENKLVIEAQKEAELFVKRNYESINKVTINKDNYMFYPSDLGGVSITGYVNGDKNLFFSVDFETTNNEIGNVTSVFKSKDFLPLKGECKENFCQ